MMQHFTILCIDDNENNLFSLQALLSELPSIEIVIANSGAKGLEILLSRTVDLILLDVQMSEMDGFSVAAFVKKNNKTAHIPIIFISAVFTTEAFIARGYCSGAIDYLAKPINENLLLNKISFYLQLFEKEKLLQNERNRLQAILDIQDNIIIVITKKKMIQVNRRFLDVTGYSSLQAFLRYHECICDLFIHQEGYLQGDKNKTWIDVVLHDMHHRHIAILPIGEKNHYFAVTVNILDLEREEFVATFTDITSIEAQSLEFERSAILDHLTHIYNRRKFDLELKKLLYVATQYRLEMAFLMIDIDYFKKINDMHGHQIGDEVLIELTRRISKYIRKGDIFARYGGEEFIVVLPKSTLAQALQKAHELHQSVVAQPFHEVGRVTVSIGVARRRDEEPIEMSIKRADEALYKAKANGRNRVETKE